MRLSTLLLLLLASQCFGAFSHYVSYTPAGSQVSGGPHTDFTAKIVVTGQTWIKSTGSGGRVTSGSGYDIVPITSSDCNIANKLSFRRISWDGTAGNGYFHVKVSSFSGSSVIYMCVGDAGVTTEQADNAAYDASTKYMFPLDDNAASTVVLDATGTVNGTNAANTSGKTVTGKLGAALTFNGSSDFVAVTGSTSNDLNATVTTVCFWAKAAATTGTPIGRWQTGGSGTGKGYGSYSDNNWYSGNGTTWSAVTADRQTDSAWHYYCWTYDSSNARSYRNGSLVGGPTAMTSGALALNSDNLNIGRDNRSSGGTYFTGDIDEVYKADATRSPDWLLTETNLGTQASFWTVSSETPLGSTRRRLVIAQ